MTGRSVGASIGGKLRCAFQSRPLLSVLLAGTCLSPVGAAAQMTNWLGGTAAYNDGANWSAGVPAFGGTAIFSNVGSANVTGFGGGGANDVGTWQFQPGASAYTFTVDSSLAFHGSGIVNNSSNAPTITNFGFAFIGFTNSATAGNARITNNSFVQFVYVLAKVFVLGFGDVFTPNDAKIGLVLNYGLAALMYLVIGKLIARALRR